MRKWSMLFFLFVIFNSCASREAVVSDRSLGVASAEEATGNVTKTPESIADAVVAGGGKFVIVKMQSLHALAVYDADEQKIVHMLRLPSANFLYTAGGNVVLVYYPENTLLQTWSLRTFEKLKTKPNPVGAVVCNMTMGHSNGSRAFIRYAVGTEPLDQASVYLLNTSTLRQIPSTSGRSRVENSSYRDFIHQRADGAMRFISDWDTSSSPSGLGIFLRSGDSWTSLYEHESVGYIATGDDGRLYTGRGNIYTNQLRKIGALPNKRLVPGIGGALFLAVDNDGNMQVYASGSTTPLGPAGVFPGLDKNVDWRSETWAKTTFLFDRRVIFDPTHGRLILIPLSNDTIIQRSFDLKTLLEQSGIDYLVVTSAPDADVKPGELWTYKIQALSSAGGVKFALELGPEGMKTANDGTLTWKVPASFTGTEKVIVLVADEGGESTYHNFELRGPQPPVETQGPRERRKKWLKPRRRGGSTI